MSESSHKTEKYKDFKQKVLDQISPSFCAAKWYRTTLWLHKGETVSCHHPKPHLINQNDLASDPSAMHNTKNKKQAREEMLSGIRPAECEYCWNAENRDPEIISDRIIKSSLYSEADIISLQKKEHIQNVNPKQLEIAFDNICNFGCSYCKAENSSKWMTDISQGGPYLNVSDGLKGTDQFSFDPATKKFFTDAFWSWWPSLKNELKQIRVTGGEPLLSQEIWKLLEAVSLESRSDLSVAINTNLGVSNKLINQLLYYTKKISRLEIFTSNEACGSHSEYIREGISFKSWKQNVELALSNQNLSSLSIMLTVCALSLESLPEFLDLILSWKKIYGKEKIWFSPTALRYPSYQSALVLPKPLLQKYLLNLRNWYRKNRDSSEMIEIEHAKLLQLMSFLEALLKNNEKTNVSDLEKEFKNFFTQYDLRRNLNFNKTFSTELTEWYNSIKI